MQARNSVICDRCRRDGGAGAPGFAAPGPPLDFEPVPRKCARHDGWTVERQRWFIAALADTGCVAIAARMVNMSPEGAYQLRRRPGAESFRRAWDAAQTLGLQRVKDEAFERAMVGQLVPVFVAGKLMGFRRKKNDRLLMFILRHYGEDAQGRKTTVNYFSTRATAGAAAPSGRQPTRSGALTSARDAGSDRPTTGEAVSIDVTDSLRDDALSLAEASTTTLKTVVTGPAAAPGRIARDDGAAAIVNAFEGVDLDAEAQAEIYRALEACAERRRALEADPENDPECLFAYPSQARGGAYLGELELGADEDWVEYRPAGEHAWQNLGEGGGAAEIDRIVAGMAERKALLGPERQAAEAAAIDQQIRAEIAAQQRRPRPAPGNEPAPAQAGEGPEPKPSTVHPEALLSEVEGPAPGEAEGRSRRSRKPYKKRTPKPPFMPPDEARKAQALVEVEAARRSGAAAVAGRRRERKARPRRD